MSKRLVGLRMLAWSLGDLGPGVKGSRTGAGDRGEMATEWRLCVPCGGEGVRQDRFHREVRCESCDGRGRFRVDPMTERSDAVAAGAGGPRTRRVLCDACGGAGRRGAHGGTCERCGGSGGFSVPLVAAEDPFRGDPAVRLEAAIEARREAGSYAELEQALSLLRQAHPRDWAGFLGTFAAPEPSEGAWDRAPSSFAEGLLLSWMPSRLRVPADVRYAWEHRHAHARQAENALAKGRAGLGHARSRRDRQIRELWAGGEGLSSDVLAERFGISARQVRSIVRR